MDMHTVTILTGCMLVLIPANIVLLMNCLGISFQSFSHLHDDASTWNVSTWNERADLYEGTFVPSLEHLTFAVTESAILEPNGFIFALFSSHTNSTSDLCILEDCRRSPTRIAIDVYGLIFRVTEYDYIALRALAESTRPFVGKDFRIKTSYTCGPFHNIMLRGLAYSIYQPVFDYVGISDYPRSNTLERPVKMDDGRVYMQVPMELQTFFGVVFQRRHGRTFGPSHSEAGKNTIRRVMEVWGAHGYHGY